MEPATCVLLVDDDSLVRSALRREIRRRTGGWDWVLTASAPEALGRIVRERFHVMVTDLNLGPGKMNGLELTRAVRALPDATPVLLYTGQDWTEAERVAALWAGADVTMSRPLERLQELFAQVRALGRMVRRVSGERPAARPLIEGLHLDGRRGAVSVHGQELPVTPNEARLLAVLLAAHPREATFAELLAALDHGRSHDHHAIHAAVGRLKRLERAGVLIEAVPGLGYRVRVRKGG